MTLELGEELPLELRQVLSRAAAAVASSPDHHLPPAYRRAIYAMLGTADPASPRGWLALITARRVAGLWQAAGRRLLSVDLLGMVEGILRGRLSPFSGRQAIRAAWRQLLDTPAASPPDPRALEAAQAAVQAMNEVLGQDPFHAVSLRNATSDAELDPATSDTARWAAAAYSGPDARRRGEFWQWWLYEAVPLAWNASAGPPGRDAIVRPKVW
jgi:hypothetical protein